MVHTVLHIHHSQNISFEIQDGGPKWPPNCDIKGINKNLSLRYFLPTILRQKLAKVE